MGYGRRERRWIELGLCLDCGEHESAPYRRCARCRGRNAYARELARFRRQLQARRLSYSLLKARGINVGLGRA